MPMRQECKHFESRTFAHGDTIRRCALGLAPDAPWRCPDDCPRYERRLADIAWTHGSLVRPATPAEPGSVDDGSAAALFESVRDHMDEVSDQVIREFDAQQQHAAMPRWKRMFKRRRS